jgi:hypothetical protein
LKGGNSSTSKFVSPATGVSIDPCRNIDHIGKNNNTTCPLDTNTDDFKPLPDGCTDAQNHLQIAPKPIISMVYQLRYITRFLASCSGSGTPKRGDRISAN